MAQLALLFFKLGISAFGGPAAHIAMLESEVVNKRKWLSTEEFLDLVGLTSIIPGPNSTEMMMHIGLIRAGWRGLLLAGLCFILPAALLTGLLAYFYQTYGRLPAAEPFLIGIPAVVLPIILYALYRLGKKALKKPVLYGLGIAVAVSVGFGLNEVIAILGGGILGMLILRGLESGKKASSIFPWPLLGGGFPLLQIAAPGSLSIFGVFLKMGSVLFGSGYVLVAYLEGELVSGRGWLTSQQLLDAVAAGQLTPGPVLTTATFVGYILQGWEGAIWATLGIFLPAFVFVAILHPIVPKLRKSSWVSAFLDSVNVSALAAMLVAWLELSKATLVSWPPLVIALLTGIIHFIWPKIHPIWLVAGGAVLGYVSTLIV